MVKAVRWHLERWTCRIGGLAHVAFQWPLWWTQPWRRPQLRLWSVGKGVGDEVMCTMVFDAIKQRNPACQITFVTRYPDLFSGHPSLHEVVLDSETARQDAIPLTYAKVLPPPRTLGHHLAECVGLILAKPAAPSLPPAPVSKAFGNMVSAWRRRLVVVQPRPSKWTPNKDWPLDRWVELVRRLTSVGLVVECGTEPVLPAMAGLVSLAGKTSLVEFAHVISRADLFLAPPSGGMNVAAAYGVSSIILYGGYEAPSGHLYPHISAMYRPVPCAPCWLTTPCPHNLKCQALISVDDVWSAAQRMAAQI